jgi:hypothetical protein
MTNQTIIITRRESTATPPDGPTGGVITTAVNTFINSGKALGYINFEILPVVTVISTTPAPVALIYTVQINYYNPALG